ncbi:MAG: hypothetical protein ACREXX_05100 [Gammaproteobacteria bacterium]
MALFDFGLIRKSIENLGGELKKLRSEREALLRKREDLEAAPICRSDLVGLLDAWVDRQGATFPKKLEAGVNYYRRHALAALPSNIKEAGRPLAVLSAVVDANATATIGSLEANLFFVLADEIKRGLRVAVESLDFTDAGPPRAERIEAIEQI